MPEWREIRVKETGEYVPYNQYQQELEEAVRNFKALFVEELVHAPKMPEDFAMTLNGYRTSTNHMVLSGNNDSIVDEEGKAKRQSVITRYSFK